MTYLNNDSSKINLLGAGLLGGIYENGEIQKFPLTVLPPPLSDFVIQQAKALYVPIDYVAGPLLVALGGAIGLNHTIEIKVGYQPCAALWLVVIGGSGTAKSPAVRKATQFLASLETDDRRIIVSDITMEALATLLERNPRGLVLISDEMAGFTRQFNRYRGGIGPDEQQYLSMWSGEKIIVDRKNDKPAIAVERPFLALVGTIQPSILKTFFTPERIYSGMAARILVIKPEQMSRKYTEDIVDNDIIKNVEGVFKKIQNLDKKIVRLSEAAKSVWLEEANRNCDEMNSLPEVFIPTWAKLEDYAGRFTLILHTTKQVLGITGEVVEADTVTDGWKLAKYFKAHTLKTYSEIKITNEIETPKDRLRRWIQTHPEFREIDSHLILGRKITGIKNSQFVISLLGELEKEGIGHWGKKGKFLVNRDPAAQQTQPDS